MKKLNHKLLLLVILFIMAVVFASGFLSDSPDPSEIDGERIMSTIVDLTNEELFPHRNVSLPGNREAAEYIAEKFESFGLEPPLEAPNFLQEYDGKILVHEPGAIDNASGTAVMMEIARVMAKEKPKRTIIFVAFNEEEAGFIGSDWLASHPIGGPVAKKSSLLRCFHNQLVLSIFKYSVI